MTLSVDNLSEASIRDEVDKILSSKGFANSPRMSEFFEYVVNEALAGRSDYLKEYRIAIDVYDREADFDPQTNPVVRVQASKLRRTLQLYYTDEGQNDLIRIDLPKGGYVPRWAWRAPEVSPDPGIDAQDDVVAKQSVAEPLQPAHLEAEDSQLKHRMVPENRQLTVLQCELADADSLTATLDAEDAFELIHNYQDACTQVIQHYGGYVARYTGGGLLVFFGYPTAFEDSPERAVRAALEISTQVTGLSTSQSEKMRIRIGIATGRVMVGDMGGQSITEKDAVVGNTPNLAMQLQGFAKPGVIVIGPRTRRLVEGLFSLEDLGEQAFAEFSEPVHAWKVLGPQQPASRFDASHGDDLVPMIGRDQEIALIEERWMLARQGEGQVVVLSGEPGIGKSRILRELQDHLSNEDHLELRYQCSSHYTNSAFYPVITQLKKLTQIEPNDSPDQKLAKIEGSLARFNLPHAEIIPALAALLDIPATGSYQTLEGSPERQRELTLDALVNYALRIAAQVPLLITLEDAHWIDPTSCELVERLIDAVQNVRVLVVVTARLEFNCTWDAYPHVTLLTLNRLARQYCQELIRSLMGGLPLTSDIETQIIAKTDGVPLFVEELIKTILDTGVLQAHNGYYQLHSPLSQTVIPDSLQDSLIARLDLLTLAKEVAQTASTIGREFTYDVLSHISDIEETQLQAALDKLVGSGLIFQHGALPGAKFRFKHALIRDTAYTSLLKSQRQQFHARIVDVLESTYPDLMETDPELTAHHLTQAAHNRRAIEYWEKASRVAISRCANIEAIQHLTQAIQLLRATPDDEKRQQHELKLLVTLGGVQMAAKGYASPEVEDTYRRAEALCHQLGDPPEFMWALHGIFMFRLIRGELQAARPIAQKIYSVSKRSDDEMQKICAHVLLGDIELYTGAGLDRSRAQYEKAISIYDRKKHGACRELFGDDPAVVAIMNLAMLYWLLGFPDMSVAATVRAIKEARDTEHPHSLAMATFSKSWNHAARHEPREARTWVEKSIELGSEQGFPDILGWSTAIHGWALCQLGEYEQGLAEQSQGIAIFQGTGACLGLTLFQSALAESFGKAGDQEEGLRHIKNAFAVAESCGEYFWEPELYRIKGNLLLAAENSKSNVEACYQQAIDSAVTRQMKPLELRAVIDLSRLWKTKRKKKMAYERLEQTYAGFTEGFDTPDMKEARTLIETLR